MKLFYREFGKGDPLIILHGLYGSSDNWLSISKEFEGKYHVILVDQRNHGQSPHSETHTYQSLVEDLVELFNDLGIQYAHIIGHSMGGKVAMLFAKLYPANVKSLIVVDIAPWSYRNPLIDDQPWLNEHERIISGMKSIPINTITIRAEAEAILSFTIESNAVRNFLLKNLKREKNKGFSWKLNLDALEQNLSNLMGSINEDLEKIDIKTLFIRGELSGYIPINRENEIHLTFTNSKILTIKNTGHWVHAEKPNEVIEAINNFLAE